MIRGEKVKLVKEALSMEKYSSLSQDELAKELKVSRSLVSQVKTGTYGIPRTRVKLSTVERQTKVKELYDSGVNTADIARQLSIPSSAVSYDLGELGLVSEETRTSGRIKKMIAEMVGITTAISATCSPLFSNEEYVSIDDDISNIRFVLGKFQRKMQRINK